MSLDVLDQLIPPGNSRGLVVVFDPSLLREKGPVVFDSADTDVLFVHSLAAMQPYLRSAMVSAQRCTVLVWYYDYESLFQTLAFLALFDSTKHRARTSELAQEAYTSQMARLEGSPHNIHRHLPELCCCDPLPFELVLVVDAATFRRDHLSPASIAVNQILRTLSYIHGGQYAVVTRSHYLPASALSVLQMLETLGCDGFLDGDRHDAKQVYAPEDHVNLYVPKLWDTLDNIAAISASKVDSGPLAANFMFDAAHGVRLFIVAYGQYASRPTSSSLRTLLDHIGVAKTAIESPQQVLMQQYYQEAVAQVARANGTFV